MSRAFRIWIKTQVKLFPDFTPLPFDYQLISWVANYAHNRGFLTSFKELNYQSGTPLSEHCRAYLTVNE